MRIGKVCGSVWSTKKAEQLTGAKFLAVRFSDKTEAIATDTVGAGVGDTVLVVFGSTAKALCAMPTDAAVCGIVDRAEIDLGEMKS